LRGSLYIGVDYLFEAHEIQPNDPLLCLSLAVSTLGRSLGRRADNRQHLLVQVRVNKPWYLVTILIGCLQGVAFLEEYRKHRGKDNLATQEVEYNFGRFFHQLSQCALAYHILN
jgi:general transcription factor 3C polypeptide 3 (transcription factor C subunit 4)